MQSLFALLFVIIAGCKLVHPVADKKFSTYVQSGREYANRDINLIRKVHYPKWKICYAINCPDASIDQEVIKVTHRQKYEKAITQALQTWLQPIAELTNKKLVGSNNQDFVYKYYGKEIDSTCKMDKLKDTLSTNAGDGEHVLQITFAGSRRGFHFKGQVQTPCLHNALSHAILLHEIGHAFGLLDTYTKFDKVTYGLQPPAIMSDKYIRNVDLALAEDDINGVQWQYRYYHRENLKQGVRPVELTDCPFRNYEYVQTSEGGACRPRHILMHNLKQAHLVEKMHGDLFYTYEVLSDLIMSLHIVGNNKQGGAHDPDINYQDKTGNTALHYQVLFGAWSLWSNHNAQNALPSCTRCIGSKPYDLSSKWLDALKSLVSNIIPCSSSTATICVDINKKNNNGDTALHIAARTGYVAATRLLLDHQGLDSKIKNKQNETACSIAKKIPRNLQEALLNDIKFEPAKSSEKIQVLQSARAKIFNLLTAENACFF